MGAARGIIRNTTTADISAKELAHIFDSQLGGSGILNHYDKLELVKVDNNKVKLSSGVYSLQGYMLEQSPGATTNFTIESGNVGYKRNDLLVAEFIRNGVSTGNDVLQFKVVKGDMTTGIATDPTLTQEDISGNGNTRQEAIYRIKIEGETLTKIERVAPIINTVKELEDQLAAQSQRVQNLNLAQSEWGDYSDGRFKRLPSSGVNYYKNDTLLSRYFPNVSDMCSYIMPVLDGSYRLLIGLEYANGQHGQQLELRYNGLWTRNKTNGTWGAWRNL